MRDRTNAVAKHPMVRSRLRGQASVLGAVAVQLHGTTSAALQGIATEGSMAGSGPDTPLALSRARVAADFGIGRGHAFVFVLTTEELLLLRRSAFGRIKEVALSLALDEVDELRVSKPGQAVYITCGDGRELRLETPKAFKFLPPVYERLPGLFADARAA